MSRKDFDRFPAGKNVASLLPDMLKQVAASKDKRIGDVTAIWEELVGSRHAQRTKVLELKGEVLYIKILSTPLYAELHAAKGALEKELQKRVSFTTVKTIVFRR